MVQLLMLLLTVPLYNALEKVVLSTKKIIVVKYEVLMLSQNF